jgi:hypothetical protein
MLQDNKLVAESQDREARVRTVDASPAKIDFDTLHMAQEGISEGLQDQ